MIALGTCVTAVILVFQIGRAEIRMSRSKQDNLLGEPLNELDMESGALASIPNHSNTSHEYKITSAGVHGWYVELPGMSLHFRAQNAHWSCIKRSRNNTNTFAFITRHAERLHYLRTWRNTGMCILVFRCDHPALKWFFPCSNFSDPPSLADLA